MPFFLTSSISEHFRAFFVLLPFRSTRDGFVLHCMLAFFIMLAFSQCKKLRSAYTESALSGVKLAQSKQGERPKISKFIVSYAH